MRILIVSPFFPPQNSIASLRPYSFAKFWHEMGHDIEILTTKKENVCNPLDLPLDFLKVIEVPLSRVFQEAKNRLTLGIPEKTWKAFIKRPISKAVHYLRFKKGIFNACRMPDITDIWAFKALKKMKTRGSYDAVVSSCGPYSAHLVAWRLKKRGQAKCFAADYRDTWSDNYIYPGLFPFNLFERVLEKKILKDADMISTISQPFAKVFGDKHGHEKTATIENGFDSDDLTSLPLEPYFPNDGKLRIVHTGSIYLGKRDPKPFFRAIKRLSKMAPALVDKLEVHFFGQRNANLEELIREEGVGKWVRFSGFVKREAALWAQRDAGMLLFLPWSDETVEGVLTGKLFEYFYSKTAILSAGIEGPRDSAEKLIEEFNGGTIVKGEESIALFLKNALEKTFIPKTEIAKTHLNSFSRKELACKFLAELKARLNTV